MSTVTTTTTATKPHRSTARIPPTSTILRDYDLHHSGSPGGLSMKTGLNHVSTVSINNAGQETSRRRVPPPRPINKNRDPAEVNVYQNNAERVFINTMFAGLYVNATAAKICRATLDRIGGEKIFRYPIGGEI